MTEWLVFDTQHSAYTSALAITSNKSLSNRANSLISVINCGTNRSLVKSHINPSDRSGTIIETEGSGGVLVMAISGDRLTIGRAVGFQTGINQAYTGPIPPMYWVRPWEGDVVSARGSGTGYFFGDSFNGPEQVNILVSGARYYYEGFFQNEIVSAAGIATNTQGIPQPSGSAGRPTDIRGDWKTGGKISGGNTQLIDGVAATAGIEKTVLRWNTPKYYHAHSVGVNNPGTIMVPVSGLSAVQNTPNSYSTTPSANLYATARNANPIDLIVNVDVSTASGALTLLGAGAYSLVNSAANKKDIRWIAISGQGTGYTFNPGASASATVPRGWQVIGGEYGRADVQNIFGLHNDFSAATFDGVRMRQAQNAIYTVTQSSGKRAGNILTVRNCSGAHIGGVFSAHSSVNIGTLDVDGHFVGAQDTANVTVCANHASACGVAVDLYSFTYGSDKISAAAMSAHRGNDNFVIHGNIISNSHAQNNTQGGIVLDGDSVNVGRKEGRITGNTIREIRTLGPSNNGNAISLEHFSTQVSASAFPLSAVPYVVSGNILTSCRNGLTTGANFDASGSRYMANYSFRDNQVRHMSDAYVQHRSGAAGFTDPGNKTTCESNDYTLFTSQGSAYASAFNTAGTWQTWEEWKAVSVSGTRQDQTGSTLTVSDTL